MNVPNLDIVSRAKGASHSQVARLAGVSRQAVSQWFLAADRQGGFVDVKTGHVVRLATGLGVSTDDLLLPLPAFSPAERADMSARYLWDQLYPDVAAFLIALSEGEDRALARLVDREGLFFAARAVGEPAWARFPHYKKLLPPARRQGLERLWTLRQNQMPR